MTLTELEALEHVAKNGHPATRGWVAVKGEQLLTLAALARRALEMEEREAGIWGRVNALAEKVLEQQDYDELRRDGISVGAAQQATHMARAACEALRLSYDDTAPADITAAVRALEQPAPANPHHGSPFESAFAPGELEQPAPTNCSGPWLSGSGGHRMFSGCPKAATWVATREQAAYNRGRQEAQGGWVAEAVALLREMPLVGEAEAWSGWRDAVDDWQARDPVGTIPPPPSDTGKGGGK
jgi:hypothetical protein